MKVLILVLSLAAMVFSCRPAKKVQKIQTAISKSDTAVRVEIKDTYVEDSIRMVKEIYSKVVMNKIEFSTFSAKVRVDYEGKDGGDEATAYIRLQKDKVMWLSLRGQLGIEGFRVLITPDSVKVMNLLKKNYQLRTIGFLQEVTQLPFDFTTLQDLVIGNPVFIDSNIISYKVDGNNELLVLMVGSLFKHLVSLDNADFKVLHSKLDDVDIIRNRTCDISFTAFDYTAGFPFSTKRNISVSEQSKLNIKLDFKQYLFNQPLTFPFSIPKNYKRQK